MLLPRTSKALPLPCTSVAKHCIYSAAYFHSVLNFALVPRGNRSEMLHAPQCASKEQLWQRSEARGGGVAAGRRPARQAGRQAGTGRPPPRRTNSEQKVVQKKLRLRRAADRVRSECSRWKEEQCHAAARQTFTGYGRKEEREEREREIEGGEEIWQRREVSFPHLASRSLPLPPLPPSPA